MLLKYKGLTDNELKLIQLKSKHSTLTNEGSNLFRLKLSKQLTNENYKIKMDKLTKAINDVESEIRVVENNKIDYNNFKISFKHFKELLIKTIQDDVIGFAKEVIDKITVYKLADKEYKI